jgi:probable phosphoglycerate mutase
MTAIYLIRHGQNDFVRKGKLPGWLPNIHLNQTGRLQAERLAESFRAIRLEAVYSSPLERALETAAALADAQGLELEIREPLGEVRIGTWEGLSLRAARRRKLWPTIQLAPSLARFPQGESFIEAQARVVGELESLRAAHKGAIACVSHADPIKLAIAHYLGLPLDQFQRLTIEPASVSLLDVEHHSARLIRLNDTHPAGPAPTG